MEIKTCESYVIARLEYVEESLELAESRYKKLKKQYEDVVADLEYFCNQMRIVENEGHPYISVDNPWSKYNPTEYAHWTSIIKQWNTEFAEALEKLNASADDDSSSEE